MKILHLDQNHPLLINQLEALGMTNVEDYSSSKSEIEKSIKNYDGLIIRSRLPVDKSFLQKAKNLKFIGRVGAGLENIDTEFAEQQGIKLFNAPEGNRDAVAEHALGLLLNLTNRLFIAHQEVKNGVWKREANRGEEIMGKTIGILGYGYMGKAFAKRLQGFGCHVICYDIKTKVGDKFAKQVDLKTFFEDTQILSLHLPLTKKTQHLVNEKFLSQFSHPIWLINTARGQVVKTDDLVKALQGKKVKGAGLDVLEYEKTSFENLFTNPSQMPEAFKTLIHLDNVILSPHIAGWTIESKAKLAQTIVDKIKREFLD
ncbi:2-hydroxyacid dehydrogenase [Flavobacteriaceae bacterium 14752]|uniref:2-hydroxyacid dehydrogenase n=1 Tax=Mesohalobacter salilacus TaxID=2491711 RepID=UPI000F63D983|nr:hydroxyacid dehydrogenase [Flavobacteriaceae bacterium 14752]